MGVPKFFRYISERYPCLSELVKEHQVSDFDNLYLDMNGIIHMCSHPDDSNPHFRITEEKIFSEIFHYISYLFQLIRPKKVFYMAVDGVAPRAKMNQQRGRRFRSAKDALDLEKKAREKGEKLPDGKPFDSNCITPGTVFMAKLHEQLRYFIKQKISTDSLWAKCRVVLSGHETPGEGEHKIMEYIRYLRTQPDHDPNTRHCLYGLDADLIMLGLCIHEPNFSLLREEVKFGKHAQRANTPDENNFFLLHLSLLKDYLEQEFYTIKDKISFEYNIEKIIDDWVLMGFLVGNDFIPPLPHLHIHTNALPILHETYKTVIVKLDGYINEGGILNLGRFEVFMKELSNLDKQNFQDTCADLKYFESKTGRRLNAQERKSYKNHVPDDNETFGNLDSDAAQWNPHSDDLKKLIQETNDMVDLDDPEWEDDDSDAGESSSDDTLFNHEFKLHRHDYYKTKLDYENVTPEVLQSQAECYVRAIQWVLHYYYQGCASWSWFYPHHYAPFITDIIDFKNMDLTFDMGTPFKPFEQLLAVLPAASKELLPEPFHYLMTDETSPIISYYPESFETDLNGKRNEWEAIVLIPFIDEVQLLSAMEPKYKYLTEEELKRNSHGPMLIYDYTPQDLGEHEAPAYFSAIKSCHARETPVMRSELDVPPDKVVRGMLHNPSRGLFYPGIPTLKNIPFTSHFTKAQVKVFEQPSRNENCILRITHNVAEEPSLEELAGKLLGKVIWVSWPHLHRAKVQQVCNDKLRMRYTAVKRPCSNVEDDEVDTVIKESNSTSKVSEFEIDKRTVIDHYIRRLGVEVGDINTIVHAVALKGYSHVFGTNGTIISGVEWCTVSSPYPLQAVLPKLEVAPIYSTRNLSIQDVLPKGEKVFLKANPYYGCIAEVVDSSMFPQMGRIKINVFVEPEPQVSPIVGSSNQPRYFPANIAAAKCGISTFLFSRITGCIFVSKTNNPEDRSNNVNVGLNIKYNKKNEELSGYTRRVDMKWQYSQKCVDLINEYHEKYPDMFQMLQQKIDQDRFTERDLFPDNIGDDKLTEISEWLKKHEFKKSSVRSCDFYGLEPDEIVELKENIVSQQPSLKQQRKTVVVQVKPHVLFKPDLHSGTLAPDPSACNFKLYHRVVNVNSRSTVPLGLKGTIVGLSQLKTHPDTVNLSDKLNTEPVYHILFDSPFLGGVSGDGITDTRLFRMQQYNLLNISQGRGDMPEMGKAIENMKLNTTNTNNITDNFKILRKGGGHNSAFANYTSPTKNNPEDKPPNIFPFAPQQMNQPMPRLPVQVQKHPAVNDEQSNLLKSLLNINKNTGPPVPPVRYMLPHPPMAPLHPQLPPFNCLPSPPIPPWKFSSPHQTVPNSQLYSGEMMYSNNIPIASPQKPFNVAPNMNMNNQNIASQMFMNSSQPQAPRNLKLPFPNKFMDQTTQLQSNNGVHKVEALQGPNLVTGNNGIPSQFVPLQAVRQRCSAPPLGSNKPYRKGSGDKNTESVTSFDLPQQSTSVSGQNTTMMSPSQVTQITSPEGEKRIQMKKRKSRLAANFGNATPE